MVVAPLNLFFSRHVVEAAAQEGFPDLGGLLSRKNIAPIYYILSQYLRVLISYTDNYLL